MPARPLRVADFLAALSLATDLAYAFPLETTLRSTLLAVGLGRELGLSGRDLADTYYAALLTYIGCTGPAADEAEIAEGDDVGFRHTFRWLHLGSTDRPAGAEHEAGANPVYARAAAALGADGGRRATDMVAASCEAGDRLAERLGMGPGVRTALGQAFERWDGTGLPGRLPGPQLAVAARILHLAHVAEAFHRVGGREAAVQAVRDRAGRHFDPDFAGAFIDRAAGLLEPLAAGSAWERALAAEPSVHLSLPASRVGTMVRALADFADLKSPFTRGHSARVADLALEAGRRLGLPGDELPRLHHAGLLHDLGRVSVPNGIWDRPGPLGPGDWERVRLYPHYTERILARSEALADVARVAGAHAERLDASGYHRGIPASVLPVAARLLSAADAYQAMSEARAHRPALSPDDAARALHAEVTSGRLDREAVASVLDAAGHRRRRVRGGGPGGLTDREVEVLRLVARGHSNRAIGERLVISEQTVRHHVIHIYAKIEVSSRASAALYAMERDLLGP